MSEEGGSIERSIARPSVRRAKSASSLSAASQQNWSLRAKKHIAPRVLFRRKLVLNLLNPLSATALNDIHYLLKAHVSPKELFLELDQAILRILIKIGITAREFEPASEEVKAVCRVERLTKHLIILFIDVARGNRVYSLEPILRVLHDTHETTLRLATRCFRENSIERIEFIFKELLQRRLWDAVFDPGASFENRTLVSNLCASLEAILAAKLL